jgi:hypothetical protein
MSTPIRERTRFFLAERILEAIDQAKAEYPHAYAQTADVEAALDAAKALYMDCFFKGPVTTPGGAGGEDAQQDA